MSGEVYALNYDKLCEQLVNLKQGSMTVVEYMQRFDELKTISQTVEDACQTLTPFKAGLRADIRRELLLHTVWSTHSKWRLT